MAHDEELYLLTAETNNQPEGPGILLFAMPFSAPASLKHTAKLIDCLAPAGRLFVVSDRRLEATSQPHMARHIALPTLHYLVRMHPLAWSALLWALKLIWIVGRAVWAVCALRRQIDVVICFQGPYYAPVLLCARLLGKRAAMFLPNSDVGLAEITYAGRRGARLLVAAMRIMQRVNLRLANICAVESQALIEPLGLRPQVAKVRQGNLYVDTDRYSIRVPLSGRPPLVGFVGRLSQGKGIMALLEAAALLRDSGIRFQIVGDGPLRAEIERALRDPDLAHVELLGWCDDAAVVERFNQYRLLVLPSDSEGLPNVVLEALACGTPALATAVGGIPDVVHHELTGFILPDRDPATIAKSVSIALRRPDLAAIGQRGRQHVLHNYSLAASADKWRALLEDLLIATSATNKVVSS